MSSTVKARLSINGAVVEVVPDLDLFRPVRMGPKTHPYIWWPQCQAKSVHNSGGLHFIPPTISSGSGTTQSTDAVVEVVLAKASRLWRPDLDPYSNPGSRLTP